METQGSQKNICAFYINLDRSPDRLTLMSDRLNTLGLPYERVSAIDGKQLPAEFAKQVNHAAYEAIHGKCAGNTDIGCFMSHLKACEQFLKTDYAYALILEDDAGFPAYFPELLNEILEYAFLWDMVRLTSPNDKPLALSVIPLSYSHKLMVNLTRQTGAGGYVLNKKAAGALLDHLIPMKQCFDHALDREWEFGCISMVVHPEPIDQCTVAETTLATNYIPKFIWYKRIYEFFYKIGSEFIRMPLRLGRWFYLTWKLRSMPERNKNQ